jgi:hypothetical protein
VSGLLFSLSLMSRVFHGVALYSVAEPATPENWAELELRGVAEWRITVPVLFLLAVGPEATVVGWPDTSYSSKGTQALLCDLSDALYRLTRLRRLLKSATSKNYVDVAISVLQEDPHRFLVLDTAYALDATPGSRAQAVKLATLADSAKQLHLALEAAESQGAISPASSLYAFESGQSSTFGFWSTRVDYRLYDGYQNEPGELPAELDGLVDLREDRYSSDADLREKSRADGGFLYDQSCDAYRVWPSAEATHAGCGLITPYGRWLVTHDRMYESLVTHDFSTGWWTAIDPNQRHVLLDVNGIAQWDETFSEAYVINEQLAQLQVEPGKASRLRRIDTGEWLPVRFADLFPRPDGMVEYSNAAGKHGLLSPSGEVLTKSIYDSIDKFHKRLRVATYTRNGKCGLLGDDGVERTEPKYANIATKFVGDLCWVLTETNRLGVLRSDGTETVAPAYELVIQAMYYHGFQPTHYVNRDGLAWEMNMQGEFVSEAGSAQAMREDFVNQMRSVWGLDVEWTELTHQEVSRTFRGDRFRSLVLLLCADDERFNSVWQELEQRLRGEPDDDGDLLTLRVSSSRTVEHELFRSFAWPYPSTTLDWKAADEISHFASHFPEVDVFDAFEWDGLDEGEGMTEGLAAADAWAAQRGYRLFSLDTDGDSYELGLVTVTNVDLFQQLADELGINAHISAG